ncbi:DUF3267 domain-containing protein [Piscibacillus salipiscarius]|uniref:DUF3267 domain-containing protein n=1 Tax=Piscibacillus salipiscarius TaxID=299480 RepID=A0ABW5Q9U5_9BACI|nr:DUF3267 domain-containing protein [Piscibacillus salipiscarius]
MKIKFGLPKEDPTFDEELIGDKWTPLKEPKSIGLASLLSIPFMLINLIICWVVIEATSGLSLKDFGVTDSSVTISINGSHLLWLLGLIVVHELIHLIFVPHFIKSKKTYIGITWQAGFVLTEDIISRSRFLVISFAPFIVLSILLPIVLSLVGMLTPLMKVLILFNAIASCVDMLNVYLIMTQVPKKGRLINNGFKTYWKAA